MVSDLIRLIILAVFAALGSGKNNCPVRKCKHHGPAIRFPFWLKDDDHPEYCAGYPKFGLSCTQNKDTVLELPLPMDAYLPNQTKLPFSVKFQIKEIDYKSQLLIISKVDDCLPALLPKLNLFASPFKFQDEYDFAFFNCSSKRSYYALQRPHSLGYPVPSLSTPSYQVYAALSDGSLYTVPLLSCSKMFQIPSIPLALFDSSFPLLLNWYEPNCSHCEAEGKFCRFKDNRKTQDIECFDNESITAGPLTKLKLAGLVLGPFLLMLIVTGTHQIYCSKKLKKEDQLKIEQFLEDYRALKPTRYTYADIKKITGNFSEKLGQGGYGIVYKGKLSNEVFVAVKVLNNTGEEGEDFINEVGTIGQIHHVNVVRLVGYCADGFRRVLVYEYLSNHSLEKFTSSENERNFLGLEKLHHIALGIAKGIEYLHQGCEQRILHFDIKPHNILLDHNFCPKISDFGQAKLCSKERTAVSVTAARGTMGYIAPEVFSRNFGKVSCKSDVYSFGMLLLEIIGCRKNITIGAQDTSSEIYFPEWIYNKLDQAEEISIQIENDNDNMITRKLMIVGLWCTQWYPVDRPSMKVVIQMLEAEGTPSIPKNPFGSTNKIKKRSTMPGSIFGGELMSIHESEE